MPVSVPMLKLVPRGAELRFWRWASPLLALVLTGVLSGADLRR